MYDRYCIGRYGGMWETFYTEGRGKEFLKLFSDESTACEYFLNWVVESINRENESSK